MSRTKFIRSATAVAATAVALSLTACVGSTPEGRDNGSESEDAGVVDRAKDKVKEKTDDVKEEVEKARKDPEGYISHALDPAARMKDKHNYEAYEWLDPGDALLVQDAKTQEKYDVSVDKFRTIDITDDGETVADVGCYDLTVAVVGAHEGSEAKQLHTMEKAFFGNYATENSTVPQLTMLMDDGDEEKASPFYANPMGLRIMSPKSGYTMTVPTGSSDTVDVDEVTNLITPADDSDEDVEDDDESVGGLGGDPGVSALDEWRGQWGFGKGGDDDVEQDDDTGEDVAEDDDEHYDEPDGDIGHNPLSLTQSRCVLISGAVPGAEDAADGEGSRAVNATGGADDESAELMERPDGIIGWLAWWRGPVAAPEDDDVSYGGWQFPLESDDEDDSTDE